MDPSAKSNYLQRRLSRVKVVGSRSRNPIQRRDAQRSANALTRTRAIALRPVTRGPIKRIAPPRLKDGRRIMGGGVPAPGNALRMLGRAWMDRGRTVTPGRGPVGADRSILQGTLAFGADYIRNIGRTTGLIRPRVSKRAGRLARG